MSDIKERLRSGNDEVISHREKLQIADYIERLEKALTRAKTIMGNDGYNVKFINTSLSRTKE